MNEKITFFIASNVAGPIRKVTLSKRFLRCFIFFLSLHLAVVTYIVVDYFFLKQQYQEWSSQRVVVDGSPGKIWPHIQKITHDINQLKFKLAELTSLEEKLRTLTRIDFKGDGSLNGVGGPHPEDIDPILDAKNSTMEVISRIQGEISQLEVASIAREQNLERILELYINHQQDFLERTPTKQPAAGRITSGYGWRRSPFTGKREFHKGIDLANFNGAPIKAPAKGIVTFVGEQNGLGRTMVIDHGGGITTRYGHLQKALKKPGDPVKRGELIARMGNTGRSTGPHLHYEILSGGAPVNPKKFIFD